MRRHQSYSRGHVTAAGAPSSSIAANSPSSRLALMVFVLAACLCICAGLFATPADAYTRPGYESDSGSRPVQHYESFKRRGWCARWGDYCVPDAKVKFADCCEGLRCVCGGLLWKPGQCQCKKPSMFG